MLINYGFLEKEEGKHILYGYVPIGNDGEVLEQSGVTISTGVDIGQMNSNDLYSLIMGARSGLLQHQRNALYKELLPYVGVKRDKAWRLIKEKPLRITQEESKHLAGAMKDKVLRELWRNWNFHSDIDFADLPEGVRTVLFSLAYNLGTNLPGEYPNTWKVFIEGAKESNWDDAIAWLTEFPTKSKELKRRRKREAEYLTMSLTSNKVV